MADVVWREVKNYPVLVNGVNVAATSPFTSNLAMCCKDEEEEIHTRQTSRTQSSGYEIFLFIVLEILSCSHSRKWHMH